MTGEPNERADTAANDDAPTPGAEAPAEGRLQMFLTELSRIRPEHDEKRHQDVITVGAVMDEMASRSLGALLLAPALLIVTPLSGVPGVPTTAGLVILLVCAQYLIGRQAVWLPGAIRRRKITRHRLSRAVEAIRPIARVLDKIVHPRLSFLVNRATASAIALICAALALTLPPLEILPFVSTTTGIIIALFGLALLARDGLLAAIALLLTGGLTVAIALWLGPKVLGLF